MSSYRNNYVPWNKNSLSTNYGSSTKPETPSTKSKYEAASVARPSSRAENKPEPEKPASKISYRGSSGAYASATPRDTSSTREPKYSLTKEPEKVEKSVREKLGEKYAVPETKGTVREKYAVPETKGTVRDKYAVPETKTTVRDKYAAPEKTTSIRDKYSTGNSTSINTGAYPSRTDLTSRIKSVTEKKEPPPVSYRSLSRAGARSRDPSPSDKTDNSNYRHYPRSYTRSTSREPDPLASSTLKYGSRTSSKEDLSSLTSRYGTTRTSRADSKPEEPRTLSNRSASITSREEEPRSHVPCRSSSISSREDASLSRYSTSRHSSKEDLSSSTKYISSRFLPKNTVEKSYTAYTRPRSISTSSSFEEKKRNRDALLSALQNAAKSPTPNYESLRNSKSPILCLENLQNTTPKSPIPKPEINTPAKTISGKQTPSESSDDEEDEETEIETDDEIEMETVTVITRGTSPTFPSNSTFIRTRRADMARILQKDITRPKKRKPMLDKEMQSDRLDDTARYSRFGSSSSAIAAPWNSYLDLKYNSPRATYSPVTNRYSGSTYSYKTKDTPSRERESSKDSSNSESTDNSSSRKKSRENSIGPDNEKSDVSKSQSEKSVPSKSLTEISAPSKSLSDKNVNSKSLSDKCVSSNGISEKNNSSKVISDKNLPDKSVSLKELTDKIVSLKELPDKSDSLKDLPEKSIALKDLPSVSEQTDSRSIPDKKKSPKNITEKPSSNVLEKSISSKSSSDKIGASKELSVNSNSSNSCEQNCERSSTELSSSSISSNILSEKSRTELSSPSVSSKRKSLTDKSSTELSSSKCNSKSLDNCPDKDLEKASAELALKNLEKGTGKSDKPKILKKSSSSSSESINSIPRTNSSKSLSKSKSDLKSKDIIKTKSSNSLSIDKPKNQCPSFPKQGAPDSPCKKQLPPIAPKSESPSKTIPANVVGLTQNKDFRKSVLNMNVDGKLVKISPSRSTSVSSDSEPSVGNEINISSLKSNSKIKSSASLSKLPQRVAKELENSRSPSSESSTTSSSEDDAQKSKKKSLASSRTSMLLSSADELSLDRPAKPPPSPRVKSDGPKTEAEAKSFIMRALAPVTNFFKTNKEEVIDKNWMMEDPETEIPKRRYIQKIESGERAWWLDNSPEEDVQKVRVSPQKEDGKFKFKKQELAEEPWWLNDDSKIPEGVERMVNDGSKMVEVNDGKHCYKIRRNESGQVEWWLDGEKSPEEKNSQTENNCSDVRVLDGCSSNDSPAKTATVKTSSSRSSLEKNFSEISQSGSSPNKTSSYKSTTDQVPFERLPSDGSPGKTPMDRSSLEDSPLEISSSDKSKLTNKSTSTKKSGHKLGKTAKASGKKITSEQTLKVPSEIGPSALLGSPDLATQYKIRHIDSGERAWWMNSQEEIVDGASKKKNTTTKEDTSSKEKSPKLNKLFHQDSGEKAWWLMSSPNIPEGIKKLDTSDSESSDEEPLGDRASPEGLEMPREIETGRLSPYDNCPSDLQKSKRPNTIPLFISRHTNIDDILGGSSQMLSPLMDRIFSFQEKKSGGQCEEIDVDQVRIHDSTAQRSVIQPNRIDVIDGGSSEYGKLDDAALQLYKDGDYGSYLDLEASISEQQEEFEGFQLNKKNSIVLRTQLSVRVHTIIEKLLTSEGRELRRALFSLKQIFQEDKDLVHEFVQNDGLACLIKVGSEADQNYQNYILRALGQVMLYVDGMNGVMEHNQTVQWLYTLIASKFRLVVKTALKLLLVFVEYTDSNCMLLIKAVSAVDQGLQSWSHIMRLLKDFNSADTELLIYAMTLVNKCLNGIPDQDTYYDQTDALEEQGIEGIIQRYMSKQGTDLDLLQQFQMYEAVLQHEDGEDKGMTFRHLDESIRKTLRNRKSVVDSAERRKSRRHSTGNTPLNVNNTNNKLKFYSTQTSTVDDEDESSSSQSSGHNDHNLNGSYKENNKASDVGVTPALRRRRERAERQRSFIREQQETAAILRATLGNTEDTENGNYTNNLQQRIQNGQLQISRNSSRKDLTPLMNAVNKLDSSEEGILKKPWVLQMMYGKPDEEVQDENDDNTNENDIKLLIALKRENTVKDLTQKLASQNILHSPSDEGKINRIGDMSGLISKAKEGLAKSKSKADVLKSPTAECPKSLEVKKSENELKWEELVNSMARPLNLCDMDFTDLASDDESDILTPAATSNGIPPPPPPLRDNAPPPPPNSNRNPPPFPTFGNRPQRPCQELSKANSIKKNKKTVKLFWKEVRDDPNNIQKVQKVGGMIWDELNPVSIDTQKLEHLFESRAKDLISKKQQELNKNKEIIVLDHKRSNAINIGMTKLPPPRSIKTAILKMDATIMNREGIEKLLTMLPTEEERTKIQDAQAANPDLPLGSAEQFLLTLASISELPARLKLWAFKLDFENSEREIAEPLMDLKQGIELLKCNKTFRGILSTLLSIGCFLNGAEVKGFQIEYLAKVPEVKDTVHKHSLLHHLCHIVMEKFPEATDLYSEIGAITRASKIDFDELALNIHRLETDCKASWDHLKLIAKHDGSTMMKVKMQDFLADCAERIILLDIVHRRVMNRYHKFLLWLGIPLHRISDSKPNEFCRVVSEFALEYRTTRERVLQQLEKKANHRERNKTRGKMITEVGKFRSKEDRADAELRQLLGSDISDVESMQGTLPWRRTRRDHHLNSTVIGVPNGNLTDDGDDEILESLVKTATKAAATRTTPRERKRTRHADRKSLRRTLKNGLSEEEKKHIAAYIKGY